MNSAIRCTRSGVELWSTVYYFTVFCVCFS